MNPSQRSMALLTKGANDPNRGTLERNALAGPVRSQQAIVNMQQGNNSSTSQD
jgi:hypothetical protein